MVTSVASANSQSISQATSTTSTAVAQAFAAVSLLFKTDMVFVDTCAVGLQEAITHGLQHSDVRRQLPFS